MERMCHIGRIIDSSRDTKQRILEAAKKLFSANGVRTTNLADITDIHLNLITNELLNCVNNFSKAQSKDE